MASGLAKKNARARVPSPKGHGTLGALERLNYRAAPHGSRTKADDQQDQKYQEQHLGDHGGETREGEESQRARHQGQDYEG